MRCDEKHGAVAAAERHFVRVCGHRAVRYGFQAIGRRIATGQHSNNTWPADRVCDVDLQDLRVWVERTHEIRVGLARQAEIVCVLPRSGEQPCVLAARRRFPDALRGMAFTGCQKRHRASAPSECCRAFMPLQLRSVTRLLSSSAPSFRKSLRKSDQPQLRERLNFAQPSGQNLVYWSLSAA